MVVRFFYVKNVKTFGSLKEIYYLCITELIKTNKDMKKILNILILSFVMVSAMGQSVRHHDMDDGTKFLDFFTTIGFGVGSGSLNPTGNLSHNSVDLDLIAVNILISVKLGNMIDTGEFSFEDADSLQFGFLIPVMGFGGEDFMGRKHKCQVYVSPLIGLSSAEETFVSGHYYHDKVPSLQGGHICHWWVDTTEETKVNITEFGGALMVRYGCGFILGKFTAKSFGISIGIAL